MRRKLLGSLLLLLILIPSVLVLAQDNAPSPTIEITGANASDLPTITITSNVLDNNNLPVEGLTIDDFTLGGDLEGIATIVSVENITTDDLPFASVLVIDTSSSMQGSPILAAKEAATLFVQSVGDNDPIAIVTFDSNVELVQDYTTDKDQLLSVINDLQAFGNTALYDAAVVAVDVAANAPVPRRAIVLLSDGAEFGGASSNLRGSGLEEAAQNGVSVYTIGLGFGPDRSYLQELALGTNARNYESPTPAELSTIYAELATLFRTQYVVTIESDIPADGASYEFTLQANTPSGATNVDTGTIRAPIPVPIVDLDDNLFAVPFSTAVTITPEINADDEIQEVIATIDGEPVTLENGSLTIDPLAYPPASYELVVTATDVDGDSGSDSVTFETAALASEVIVNFAVDGEITEATTVTVSADGQTPASSASYTVVASDGTSVQSETSSDVDGSFPFTIDPFALPVDDYELFIGVENEGGATANVTVPFSVGGIAPQNVSLDGIDANTLIEEPTSFTVTADAQEGATILETTVTIAGEDAPLDDLTIRPAALQPGIINLDVTVTDSNGQSTTETIPVEIASLPPQITFSDLSDPVITDTSVDVFVDSQTELISVIYNFSDGIDITLDPLADGTYPSIPLNIEMFEDGEATLVVEVTNTGGLTTTESLTFNVVRPTSAPDLTATNDADIALANAAATSDTVATTDAQDAINVQATSDAQSTIDADAAIADAQATTDAQSTNDAIAIVNAQATTDAQSTSDAIAVVDTQATSDAQSTNDANAAATAQAATETRLDSIYGTATAISESNIGAQANADAQATIDAQSTIDAQADMDAQSTSDAQAMLDTQSTLDAQATIDAQSTLESDAAVNAQADAQATTDAQSTSDAQATTDAQSTSDAQATTDAQSTSDAQATTDAQSTIDAQASIDAQSTSDAQASADAENTSVAQAATDAVTEEASPTMTVTPSPTLEVTLTPVEIVEVTAQDAENPPAEGNLTGLLLGCGAVALILILIFILWFGRGRDDDNKAS